MANSGGHQINIPYSEDSDDDYSTKAKIVKLNRHNWHDWKSAFEDIIIGKGHEEILDEEWIKSHTRSKIYRRKNALALSLLRTSVEKDLQLCIKSSKSDFTKAYRALATECGANSLVVVGDTLIRMVNLTYEPGKSLREHTSAFKNAYINLCEMIDGLPPSKQIMSVSTGLAAILFIKSLRLDEMMSSLVSTLYDLRPFTVENVAARVLLEDSRRVSNSTESTYYALGPQKDNRSNRHTNRPLINDGGQRQSKPRSVVPTRKNPQEKDQRGITAQIERLDREIQRLKSSCSVNAVEEETCMSDSGAPQDDVNLTTEQHDDPEDYGFLIQEEAMYSPNDLDSSAKELIYDSGASRSTVCNLSLLQDPQPIQKQLNTYGGSIDITHVGKLNIGGTTIHPVFYAPNGPRNLISATQLEDHGLKVVHKHRTVLVKLGNQIVYRFPRIGNLYMSQHNPSSCINLAKVTSANLDWHITLGHPFDGYLKKFLSLNDLPTPTPFPSSAKCEVCSQCKIKHQPHSNSLPTSSKPFHRPTSSQKSTTGYVVTLYGNPISWTSKKQSIVAQSTTEAESVAMNLCAKQVRWLSTLILGLGITINKPKIKNDNQGANFISKEAQLNPNSRHIEIRFQYIRDLVQKSLISVEHTPSEDMIADILTKPLGYVKVIQARLQLHLTSSESRRSVS